MAPEHGPTTLAVGLALRGSLGSPARLAGANAFQVNNNDGFGDLPHFSVATDAEVNATCAGECAARSRCAAIFFFRPQAAPTWECLGLASISTATQSCPPSFSQCASYVFNGVRATTEPSEINTGTGSESSDDKVDVPMIIGWVLAAVALVVLIGAIAYVRKRRGGSSRRSSSTEFSNSDSISPGSATFFDDSHLHTIAQTQGDEDPLWDAWRLSPDGQTHNAASAEGMASKGHFVSVSPAGSSTPADTKHSFLSRQPRPTVASASPEGTASGPWMTPTPSERGGDGPLSHRAQSIGNDGSGGAAMAGHAYDECAGTSGQGTNGTPTPRPRVRAGAVASAATTIRDEGHADAPPSQTAPSPRAKPTPTVVMARNSWTTPSSRGGPPHAHSHARMPAVSFAEQDALGGGRDISIVPVSTMPLDFDHSMPAGATKKTFVGQHLAKVSELVGTVAESDGDSDEELPALAEDFDDDVLDPALVSTPRATTHPRGHRALSFDDAFDAESAAPPSPGYAMGAFGEEE
mmetsp:Transcript_24503/g.73394  ORF Transcript_24503/g.73394 Transcript_24503/m.73394 type:complete len:521 (-) Transcript_24503:179-1741(-)